MYNHSLKELEKLIISGIITTRGIGTICDTLSENDFISSKEKRVYKTILSYFSQGSDDWLLQTGIELEKAGISISEYLESEIVSTSDLNFYVNELKELKRKTLLTDLFIDSQSRVKGEKLNDFIIGFNKKFSKITADGFLISGDIAKTITEYEDLQEIYADKIKNGIELMGIDTGFEYLNKVIDGLRPSHLWIIGGYCLGKDTKVLMFNGESKKVQDIKQGDLLCSVNDTKPRKVLATNIGSETMYKITGKYIDSFCVNAGHILPMIYAHNGYKSSKEIKMTASDYMKLSIHKKNKLRLLKSPAEFSKKKLKLDPYFMGYWIGDGTVGAPQITIHKKEIEIINYCKNYAKILGLRFVSRIDKRKGHENVMTIGIKTSNGGDISTRLNSIKNLLPGEKIIGKEYLTSTLKDRMELLAGLIDSDGYVSGVDRNGFVFCQKDLELIKQVRQLAESCGFNTNIKKCFQKESKLVKNCAGNEIYKLNITGHTYKIPTKIKRKQITNKIKICKYREFDLPITFEIEEVGIDNYYGFELDGNHLFLVENNIVNHNTSSGKTFLALNIIANLIKQKKRIGFYSLEMSKVDIFGRLLGIMLGENSLRLLKGYTTPEIHKRTEEVKNEIRESKMFLYTELSDLESIKLSMIRENMKNKVDLFVLDYIQLLQANGKSEYENMKMAITDLQRLAIKLEVSVIILSQVSNAAARDRNSVVIGYKGSGDIAAAADLAIELLPEKEDLEIEEFCESDKYNREVKLLVKKNRHGLIGTRDLIFNRLTGVFKEK